MPEQHNYEYCVFFSHAKLDDRHPQPHKNRCGWVTLLVDSLRGFLATEMRRQFRREQLVWYDESDLDSESQMTQQLKDDIARTACLVVLMSDNYLNSPWCKMELEEFHNVHNQHPDYQKRVFLLFLEKYEDLDQFRNWPKQLADKRGTDFWYQPPLTTKKHDRRLYGSPLPNTETPEHDEFYKRVEKLAKKIATIARPLFNVEKPTERQDEKCVEVPETSGTEVAIESLRNLLKRGPDKGDLDRLWRVVRKDDTVALPDGTEKPFDKLSEEQKVDALLGRLLSENDISVDGHLQKIEVLVAETTQRGPNGKLADRSQPSCLWFCNVLWHCVAIRIQQDMVAPLLSKIANKETRLRGVSVPSVAEVVVLTAMSNLYRSGRDGGPLLPSFSQRRTIEIDGQQHCIGDGAIPLDDLPLDGKHATLQYVLHVVERGVQMPRPIRPDQNLEDGQLERNLGQLRTHLKQKIGGLKPKAYYGILPLREPSSGPDNHSETISQFERFCAELGGYFQLVQLGDRYDMTEREIQLDFLIQQHFSLETE